MSLTSPPGVFDIIPNDPQEEWRNSHLWNHVESVIRQTAKSFGYEEIRTPIFERTELFLRGVGETSDIVSKEMYTFEDKGKRSMTLRPEGTAPVVRAFIEHQLQTQSQVHKFFLIAPMFRYDRPQAGRYRQHHQFGAEVFGNGGPEQDVEVIDFLYTLYTNLGLKNLKVYLNSMGDVSSRLAFREALLNYFRPLVSQLSEDSQKRLEANPLRILDSKDPKDIELAKKAPSILNFLNEECKTHFEKVQSLLKAIDIPFEINTRLVRGLDYYNKTVFEIVSGDLGAQNSIGGGGRYDGLMKLLGGPDIPAIGFGSGIERIIQTMINQKVTLPTKSPSTLFIIPLGEEAQKKCFILCHLLRQHGVSTQMDFSGRKLAKVMQYADQTGAKYVTVIGENELKNDVIELKEMSTGRKFTVHIPDLIRTLEIESKSRDFIEMVKEFSHPFTTEGQTEFFKQKILQSLEHTNEMAKRMQQSLDQIKHFFTQN